MLPEMRFPISVIEDRIRQLERTIECLSYARQVLTEDAAQEEALGLAVSLRLALQRDGAFRPVPAEGALQLHRDEGEQGAGAPSSPDG